MKPILHKMKTMGEPFSKIPVGCWFTASNGLWFIKAENYKGINAMCVDNVTYGGWLYHFDDDEIVVCGKLI